MASSSSVIGKSNWSSNRILTRIILPEDYIGDCCCNPRTGGQPLTGWIEIVALDHLDLGVEVRFEGVYRTRSHRSGSTTWCVGISEEIFLQEIEEMKDCSLFRNGPDGSRTSHYAFNFAIPLRLVAPRSDLDSTLLKLYPSAKLGSFYRSFSTEQQFVSASILYRIVAIVTAQRSGLVSSGKWECSREILLWPTRPPDPPLYIDAYPKEFKLHDSINLRRHFLDHPLGELEIFAEEPLPVNLSVSTPRAGTFVELGLSFTPNGLSTRQILSKDWTIVTRSNLRLCVFHSTKRCETEPSILDAKRLNHVFMRLESMPEEVRQYRSSEWIMNSNHFSQNTKLVIAISVPKTLPPSFLAPFAALRYHIVLKVSILGVSKTSASLVVPVQLYRSHLMLTTGDKNTRRFGVFGEDPSQDQELALDGNAELWEDDGNVEESPPVYRNLVL